MGLWRNILKTDTGRARRHLQVERRRLLPAYDSDPVSSTGPSKEITKVALRLKYQIERVIPCEVEENVITSPTSRVITDNVVRTAKEAGGEDLQGCVVFCLLVCLRWFKIQAIEELWDSDLHESRALACEVIAKRIIETEENQDFLLLHTLLKRYSVFVDGEETVPANVIERAVDLHALRIIGSSGYQKCIKYLWNGWFCQQDGNPTNFVPYHEKDNTNFAVHFHPDRMRTPLYQNACQIAVSLVYLALYTQVINTVNRTGDLDVAEGILYMMTLAFTCDELTKVWKIGRHYFDFWNAFNSTLYAILAVSFFVRVAALTHSPSADDQKRQILNELSYNFLAFAGPMFWMRMMLYMDSFRFFGAMFVVLRVMMKESIIFFALLFVVLVGFFQAFYGMAQVESDIPVVKNIVQGMANSIMQSPEFGTFEDFAYPFGIILYYLFNFIIMTVYGCLRAENDVLRPGARRECLHPSMVAFNLIEIIFLIAPFEWWLPRKRYAKLNDIIMGIIYSPILLITASLEAREARRIRWNRRRGEEDDDDVQEWEHAAEEVDFAIEESWKQTVQDTTPNVTMDSCTLEIIQLKEQIRELTETVKLLVGEKATKGTLYGGSSSTILERE
ncbi:hypothetical protein BDV32DRAFT_139050 [Aspergillus pseudonomiae]|uniref:YVC1 N-terminal linker helical domain-containing protein n=1 Tax=Aspergillus pseudonomiae TaxID=1506151 RepID=A0A5N6HXE1_9EURO|nr:uncharacterized protein BDV37DRAFT_271206 [Aspergillus pseudonomiae]KAB8259132.1 hypothetical protein BDV32DRAFT_139050 [Aspergillus pseudonomiae]KAE8404757.1 hypothetical protein BDV37DRAFT_271206 [Aspergillus pseudonomiae]